MYGQPMMQPAYGQPMMQPGYQQPMMQPVMQPAYMPPPPQQQGPTIITIGNNNNSSGSPCQFCQGDTGNITRKKVGCVTIAWCICLLFTVGAYGLCVIPFCMDSCKDTEILCVKCQQVKTKIPANCC